MFIFVQVFLRFAKLEGPILNMRMPLGSSIFDVPTAAVSQDLQQRKFLSNGFWDRLLGQPQVPFRVAIFSDFDGTISEVDSLKYILNRFGESRWHGIENAMARGTLPERQGLSRCFEFYHESYQETLKAVLESVPLDRGFSRFRDWASRNRFDLTVLSGGFESFIHPLFRKYGLENVKVLANDASEKNRVWNIQACNVSRLCDLCNHCKTFSLVDTIRNSPETLLVYIGDGHTDSCPVQYADIVFAKGHLAKFCREREIPFFEFRHFEDILRQLKWRLRFIQKVLAGRRIFFKTEADQTSVARYLRRRQMISN